MIRSNLMRVVLIAASILIIVGVTLMTLMLTTADDRNVIKISIDDGQAGVVEFENLALTPGGSSEYNIELKQSGADNYMLTLDFIETAESPLKEFAYVRIVSDDQVVCDKLLANAFEDESIVLPVDFRKDQNTKLTVIYYLPIDVGNEAKKAEAFFKLQLTAGNE